MTEYDGPIVVRDVTLRDEDFDYSVGRVPWLSGGITATSAPRPEPFTWGRVIRVHRVGEDYAIVEYAPRRAYNVEPEDFDPSPRFSVFVRGARGRRWDTGHSWRSLDEALIAAIAWRAERRLHGDGAAANSQAVRYISRLLELKGTP